MTPTERLVFDWLMLGAESLKVAARTMWERGNLVDAAKLYTRADVAESKAHYFEAKASGADAAADELFRYGRPML